MKKLVVCVVCSFLALSVQAQQQKKAQNQRVNAGVARQIQKAQQNAPVKIAGDKRLLTVTFEVQSMLQDDETLHYYWDCPAALYTKDGALAFDGECWKAVEMAAAQRIGPSVRFFVDLGKFGDFTEGEDAGSPFYFDNSYAVNGTDEDEVVNVNEDEYAYSANEAFKRSQDKSYIQYRLPLLTQYPEIKKALADYYRQNNLKDVSAETLSRYFKQQHASTRKEIN